MKGREGNQSTKKNPRRRNKVSYKHRVAMMLGEVWRLLSVTMILTTVHKLHYQQAEARRVLVITVFYYRKQDTPCVLVSLSVWHNQGQLLSTCN